MRKLTFLIVQVLLAMSLISNAQNLKKFKFKDTNGCSFEFQLESSDGNEVTLLSASNNGMPTLEIPSTATYKDVSYTVVRAMKNSLKKCDKKIRVLIFPSSMRSIGGFLFGNYKTSLKNVRLESLKIPYSVKSVAPYAFTPDIGLDGADELSASIDELPEIIKPWSRYGISKDDIIKYWQEKDPSKISEQCALEAKYKFLKETSEAPLQERNANLTWLNGTDIFSYGQSLQLLHDASEKGATREEYIAALQGNVDSSLAEIVELNSSNSSSATTSSKAAITIQDIDRGQFSITDIVGKHIKSSNNTTNDLLAKLKADEADQNYGNAKETLTQMMKYSSDPILFYARAICNYKTNHYGKSWKDCRQATLDGRLSDEYVESAKLLWTEASGRYKEKLDGIVEVVDVVGNSVAGAVTSIAPPSANTTQPRSGSSTLPSTITNNSAIPSQAQASKVKCTKCDGSGKCVPCKGTGKRTKHYKKNGKWENTIECPYCEGSGVCSFCDGSCWIDTEDVSQPYSSASLPSTSSTKSSAQKTYRTCSWCNGSGRVLNETIQYGFSLQGKKKGKCGECGAQLYEGKGHKHYNCSHCNGTGKLEN